jgi:hypothetical protein
MDHESDRTKELEKQIQELEFALKTEKIKAGFLNKLIDTANEEYGLDIKKIQIPPASDSKNLKS